MAERSAWASLSALTHNQLIFRCSSTRFSDPKPQLPGRATGSRAADVDPPRRSILKIWSVLTYNKS
jgi:hypothetical protein